MANSKVGPRYHGYPQTDVHSCLGGHDSDYTKHETGSYEFNSITTKIIRKRPNLKVIVGNIVKNGLEPGLRIIKHGMLYDL